MEQHALDNSVHICGWSCAPGMFSVYIAAPECEGLEFSLISDRS